MVSDEEIIAILIQPGATPWDVAEALCDKEVARGDYEGCSTDLELAFVEYERRAKRLQKEIE